jgi:hypothetical protein
MAVRTVNIYTCDVCEHEESIRIGQESMCGWIVVIEPIQQEEFVLARDWHFCSDECLQEKFPNIEEKDNYRQRNSAYAVRY